MNAVTTLLREFDAVTEEYNKAKLAVTEKLKPQFHDIFKDYLEAHPCIATLEVIAYTPYFSDGDECIYSVGELGATLVDYEVDYAPEFFDSYTNDFKTAVELLRDGIEPSHKHSKAENYAADWKARNSDLLELGLEKLEAIVVAQEAGRDLQSTVASIPDDVFRDLFGDHVKVTIDRDGVTTDSYDHD